MKAKDKGQTREIAERRVGKLFEMAKDEAKARPELSKRYVKLAREIARKTQTKIPQELKRNFCKKCGLPFTARSKARTKKGFLVYTCAGCGEKRRLKIKN
mgnify:CR=1 FL=1